MPRLVASQDARSIVLKHHHDLYDELMSKLRSLRRASPINAPSLVAAGVVGPSASSGSGAGAGAGAGTGAGAGAGDRQLKSALKKQVSFAEDTKPPHLLADDGHGGSADEGEGSDEGSPLLKTRKQTEREAARSSSSSREKIVVPGSDVVVEALVKESEKEVDVEADGENAEKGEGDEKKKKEIHPIDVNVPLRSSLSRLLTALKADTSAASIGSPIAQAPADSASQAQQPSSTSGPKQATVEDAYDLSSDEDSLEGGADDDDDDELEFDPFGGFAPKARKGRKHGQRPATPPSASASASGTSTTSAGNAGTALRASLSGLSTLISTQTYMASSAAFNTNFRYSGMGDFGLGGSSSTSTTTTDGAGGERKEENKGVDISVVKAEIRGLKGLLLSRRNFPSYGRPNLIPQSAVQA